MFDDEMDPDNASTEKTVTLSVADGLWFFFAFCFLLGFFEGDLLTRWLQS